MTTLVALAGNPNSGKTTLFNRLTGLRQRVGNYPGITVERRLANARFGEGITIVDLPGAYSLAAQSRDEAVAFEVITGRTDDPAPALTVIVVDASNLDRNLYFALSILELGRPCVIALNMVDAATTAGREIEATALAEALGVPVVPIVAKRGIGIEDLTKTIEATLAEPPAPYARRWTLDDDAERTLASIAAKVPADSEGAARSDGVAEAPIAAGVVGSRREEATGVTPWSDEAAGDAPGAAARSDEAGSAARGDEAGSAARSEAAPGAAARSDEATDSAARSEAAPGAAARSDEAAGSAARSEAAPGSAARSDDGADASPAPRATPPISADRAAEAAAIWALTSLAAAQDEAPLPDGPLRRAAMGHAELAEKIIEARYTIATETANRVTRRSERPLPASDRIDAILLHPVLGVLTFAVVMAIVFQSIFAWAEPLMDLIEATMGAVQGFVAGVLPEGALRDLVVDGIVGGVGNVIVFLPQIAILFLFIAVLEDSGYLARAAFISDRMMARIGLHGRAFVPLMSGFACAVPAIMAARSIESPKDRLVTILVTPLISCSARLPVYILIIAALFSSEEKVWGVLSVGGLLMLVMYALSVLFTVAVAFVLKRTLLKSPTPPLVLELPPYRAPELGAVIRQVYDRCKVFVRDAGTIILACSIVLWALLYFPRNPDLGDFDPYTDVVRLRDATRASLYNIKDPEKRAMIIERSNKALKNVEQKVAEHQLGASYAGRIGHALEPVIEPLGYDWKIGIGLLASFAAREVFVSTMGLVYGVGDEVDEEDASLREKMAAQYTPLVGLSLMIFFLLAAQCMSTIAVVRRETQSWRWPLFMLAYMNVLAWIGAFLTYQGGRLLGFT